MPIARPLPAPTKGQVLGCLFGGALGDAWGGPHEGRTGPVVFRVPSRPVLSDDTQLTLATCESILDIGRVDPENLASHLLRWFTSGRLRGIGSSTLKAMRDLSAGTHWAVAGARGEYAAGNGAAMRIAPLAFVLNPNRPEHRTLIRDVCRITHHSDEAYVGALAVLLAIQAAIAGAWSPNQSFLALIVEGLPDSAVRDRIEELSRLELPALEIARKFGATGYVVDTVPLALQCAQAIASESLTDALTRTIRLGGDTDTIASIAGQVAGTDVGLEGIPQALLDEVNGSDELKSVGQQFAEFVVANPPSI